MLHQLTKELKGNKIKKVHKNHFYSHVVHYTSKINDEIHDQDNIVLYNLT
jgi:hypothetical protein